MSVLQMMCNYQFFVQGNFYYLWLRFNTSSKIKLDPTHLCCCIGNSLKIKLLTKIYKHQGCHLLRELREFRETQGSFGFFLKNLGKF